MTNQVEEQAYRWPRRYVFAITLAVVIMAPIVFVFFA